MLVLSHEVLTPREGSAHPNEADQVVRIHEDFDRFAQLPHCLDETPHTAHSEKTTISAHFILHIITSCFEVF